jgi:hypothetical protein
LKFIVKQSEIDFGKSLSISFQRTLRIPDDGRIYPLPPGLGKFPIHRVENYLAHAPPDWKREGGVFIPMYQREALWISFRGDHRKPHAVKIGVGKINAVSGEPWDNALHNDPQDYLVCPSQPWLDGINAGDGYIRQFVALPLGQGATIEAQLSGKEEFGGVQILVFKPKRGFSAAASRANDSGGEMLSGLESVSMEMMGIGAGGKMKQKIYPDLYGSDIWDQKRYASIFVHLVNSKQYEKLTGLKPPPTPVSPQIYTESGLPWFDLYDEERGHLRAPKKLRKVKPVNRIEGRQGISMQDDEPVNMDKMQIRKLHPKTSGKDKR